MKKLIVLLASLSCSLSCYAQDNNQWQTPKYKAFVKDQLLNQQQAYQAKAKACYEQGLKANFSDQSINKIKSLNLSQDALEATIIYFLYKANLECQGSDPIMTAGLLNEARNLEIDGFSKSSDPNFKKLNNTLVDTQSIIRSEYLFTQLPKEKQNVLLSIEEFKKPFDLNILSKLTQ